MFNKTQIATAISAVLMVSAASAEQLETIEVIGSQTELTVVDPHLTTTVLENIMPTTVFGQGGVGGFAGFTERGTKSNHTAVYRNGVPVNDAGAGWYDFGHDLATGNESARVVNGPQGSLYGTASMGGTVFVNDTLARSVLVKLGDDQVISASPNQYINYTKSKIDNGSARSDNTETDLYRNETLRLQSGDLGMGFVLNYAYTEYTYDYDGCYASDWSASNNCEQQGERQTLSLRNDHITFGYNSNSAEYYTDGDYLSYSSDAKNYYFDARDRWVYDRNIALITGVTVTREEYIDKSVDQIESYALVQYQDWLDLGFRYTGDTTVARIGATGYGLTLSISNSYRNPNLYELNGDGAWVFENQDLEPEEGSGVELGYGAFTVFKYDFTQGIDFDFASSTYVNTGEYQTQGIRFTDTYSVLGGDLTAYAGYTDTDQQGVPKRKANVTYGRQFGPVTVSATYTTQQDRGTDWAGSAFDDVETVDLALKYDYSSRINITLIANDLFDREFEIAPGYGAGGQQINLTITYR